MSGVGIVGFGISGLQLGLFLIDAGVEATLYSERSMDEIAAAPLPNTVTRWGPTMGRERSLGLVASAGGPLTRLRFRVQGTPVDIDGALSAPADSTDFRIYLPWLLDTYLARGGRLRIEPCGPAQLAELTRRHDLVVVAAGHGGFGELFPIDPVRSPYREPQRHWNVGLYDGIELPGEAAAELTIVPGVGEVLHAPMRTFSGEASVVSVIAAPEGPLGGLLGTRWAHDRPGFVRAVLAALRAHAPHVHARIDERAFGPLRDADVLQGTITPTVRRPWAEVDGRYAVAIGDAWVLNDPIAAQGANVGSRTAFALGAAIVAGGPFDDAFARRMETVLWSEAEGPTMLSNALLAPPGPEVVGLLMRAAGDGPLGDRVVDGLGHPEDMVALFAEPPVAETGPIPGLGCGQRALLSTAGARASYPQF